MFGKLYEVEHRQQNLNQNLPATWWHTPPRHVASGASPNAGGDDATVLHGLFFFERKSQVMIILLVRFTQGMDGLEWGLLGF